MNKMSVNRQGFTIVEISIVVGIIMVLAAFTVPRLTRIQTVSSLDSAVSTLAADLKSQQMKAMSGDTLEIGGSTDTQGVHIGASEYTLFRGPNHTHEHAHSFTIEQPSTIRFSSTFPGSRVIFERLSGQVQDHSDDADTITVTDTASGEQKTIEINAYGTIINID